jgi:hypothetical protein
VNYRSRSVKSLIGELTHERPYYHCKACGWSVFIGDAELGLQEGMTPGAKEVIALHGNLEPFEEAAIKGLQKSAGLRVSGSTVRRISEWVGKDIHDRRNRGETFGSAKPWDWRQDSDRKRCAYVSLDATGVAQQGPHGEKAEGRMPWVGAVFNPLPRSQSQRRSLRQARYVSALGSLDEIGDQLRREVIQVGGAQADRVIGLTDGGNGLEDCLIDRVFSGLGPEIFLILDFWHAAEHLHEFAAVLWPQDQTRRDQQAETWCHLLKHQGGEQLLATLRSLDLTDSSSEAQESHRLLINYVRVNLHRMDYPTYILKGWQIGSGTIESACKNVVGGRMKGSGMRWRPHGTTGMCQLRALFKSERTLWDAYWSRNCGV